MERTENGKRVKVVVEVRQKEYDGTDQERERERKREVRGEVENYS